MANLHTVLTLRGIRTKDLDLALAEVYFLYHIKEIKVNSFITIKKDIPDPGSYNPSDSLKKGERQYSFSKAKKFSLAKIEFNSLTGPGPGNYKVDTSLE